MSTALAEPTAKHHLDIRGVEAALVRGDLSGLSEPERIAYYAKVCESVGLNPFTRPFEYIEIPGRTNEPAKKDSTDPAFLVREVSGFPVALCWSKDKADRIAADHNAKLAAISRPPCNPQEPPIGWESPR